MRLTHFPSLLLVALIAACVPCISLLDFRDLPLDRQIVTYEEAVAHRCLFNARGGALDAIASHGIQSANAMADILRRGDDRFPLQGVATVLSFTAGSGIDLRSHPANDQLRKLVATSKEKEIRWAALSALGTIESAAGCVSLKPNARTDRPVLVLTSINEVGVPVNAETIASRLHFREREDWSLEFYADGTVLEGREWKNQKGVLQHPSISPAEVERLRSLAAKAVGTDEYIGRPVTDTRYRHIAFQDHDSEVTRNADAYPLDPRSGQQNYDARVEELWIAAVLDAPELDVCSQWDF